MKTIFYSLLLLILFSSPAHSLQKLQPGQAMPHDLFINLAKKLNPTVVNISTAQEIRQRRSRSRGGHPYNDLFELFLNQGRGFGGPSQRPGGGLGTGFIISNDGLIITNNHVIDNADIINVQLSGDKKKYEAEVVGRDKRTDIALIKIKTGFSLPTAKLGTSSNLQVGEWVAAFGNPFGHTHSMSKGIVSAIGRQIDELNRLPFIQTDASINPGNSGGPLVNTAGEVIGVNTAIDARAQGIGFAIPVDDVRRIVEQLEKHGGIKRGFLGVSLADVNNEQAADFGLPGSKGALIARVSMSSPAKRAGLKEYDFITHYNGQRVKDSSELVNKVSDSLAGNNTTLKIIRNGKKKTIKVKLGQHPDSKRITKTKSKRSYSGQKSPYDLGFYFKNYNQSLAKRFDLAPLRRARPVIIEVKPGTPASKAGLYPGDVILDVNKSPVYKSTDVIKKLKKNKINILRVLRYDEVALIYISADS